MTPPPKNVCKYATEDKHKDYFFYLLMFKKVINVIIYYTVKIVPKYEFGRFCSKIYNYIMLLFSILLHESIK